MNADDAVRKVLIECRMSGMQLYIVLLDVIKANELAGETPDVTADSMIQAYWKYKEAQKNLKYAWGIKTFFGEDHWSDESAWPWKPEYLTERAVHEYLR